MSGRKKLSTKEFIENAKEIHGDKYDYSKVNYINAHAKVCIICPEHGEFWQTPIKHVNSKNGCPYCANNIKHTTAWFIKKAKQVHGDKYDYSKVNYVNRNIKVCIIDKKIGEFWQLPFNHLNGYGPNKTRGEKVWSKRGRITTDDFIEKAKEIHGSKYNYDLVNYVDCNTNVKIICNKCGKIFQQKPKNHINLKHGCPFCNESKLEKEVENMLIDKNILFERQKHFKWLGKQSLDFYLPEHNIAIECQGEQHYRPVDFAGRGNDWAEKQFDIIKKRDLKKMNKCINNGIKILYYSPDNKNIII